MSTALGPYIETIRKSLTAALCIQNHASQIVERHNKPEIEAQQSKELVLNPMHIRRDEDEAVLIEPSINSVRISILFSKNGAIEHIIADRFMHFLMQRAEEFHIMRRKPVEGYDISFLVTNFHMEAMFRDKLVDLMLNFIQDIGREINSMKLQQNMRARAVVTTFLSEF
uniref:Actin-related protein 2/3 complex subunit 4 n=1 Tax=Percolomonas cosmopolitus TaxID=63605 RepID=A0A7S1KMZ3_9EUKA|eukprot:CAMPEP_0117446290 /NCGR_PEP_ID=MMETSP0759-20121206/6259_1 /TAXON_ID=63605 /ORGANISM="Percolomonas cosmopolitus, Strain WS" /LENGTH=168 /DNA_ID=CAMNT_0005238541 /DNA_START=24 /DNA_END=530 /DNA_ORIENTATION=-